MSLTRLEMTDRVRAILVKNGLFSGAAAARGVVMEQEFTKLLLSMWSPDTGGREIRDPFNLPPVMIPKMYYEDVMALVQKHISSKIMPGGASNVINETPQFLVEDAFGKHSDMTDPKWQAFPNVKYLDGFGMSTIVGKFDDARFAFIGDDQVDIMIKLDTLHTWVRFIEHRDPRKPAITSDWIDWYTDRLPISVNPWRLENILKERF